MEKVLITGGTGFIGAELVRRLCAAGLRPRILVRRPHRAAVFRSLDVELVHGDLRSPPALRRAMKGIDTVFHLGARASFESYRRLRPTLVDGSIALARAAAEAGATHLVLSSSIFVYDDQEIPVDAATVPRPRLDYGRAKLEAETAMADIGTAAGMSLAAVRLPHVYGPQGILFQQIQRGYAIFPGPMRNRCGILHVEDAARILEAVGATRSTGRSAVADNHSATWAEYFDVLATLHPSFRLYRFPRWLGYAGGVMLEPILSGRRRPTLYTRDTVAGFNLDLPVEPGLLWSELGIEPRYPTIHEGIAAALDGCVHFRWRHPLLDRRAR
jgi:nucleoside-diphosphate-sugar epimerase